MRRGWSWIRIASGSRRRSRKWSWARESPGPSSPSPSRPPNEPLIPPLLHSSITTPPPVLSFSSSLERSLCVFKCGKLNEGQPTALEEAWLLSCHAPTCFTDLSQPSLGGRDARTPSNTCLTPPPSPRPLTPHPPSDYCSFGGGFISNFKDLNCRVESCHYLVLPLLRSYFEQ